MFLLIDHLYPTRFADNNFKICDFNLKLTCFGICFRRPTTCKKFITKSKKPYTSSVASENKIKEKTLNFPKKVFILLNSYYY